MKSYAIAFNKHTGEQSTISAFDAFLFKEKNKSEFKNFIFYYEKIDKENKVYVRFKKSTQRAHFAYYSKKPNRENSESEGESLSHYVVKKALAQLPALHLVNEKDNIDFYLKAAKSENEKLFTFSNNYRADVYYELDKNQPDKTGKSLFYKWCGKLVIEVKVTHKTNSEKCEAFEENGIPIFEVSVSGKMRDKYKLDQPGAPLTIERIENAISEMKKIFSKKIYGRLISDPTSKEYAIMCKYKKEIDKFKKAYEKHRNEFNSLRPQVDAKRRELEELNSKIDFYRALENDNNNLSQEKIRLTKSLDKLREENQELRQKLDKTSKNPLKGVFKKFRKR